ncbi:MAG: hypothetical protein AAGF12_36330 [Myxococcota bacterium]
MLEPSSLRPATRLTCHASLLPVAAFLGAACSPAGFSVDSQLASDGTAFIIDRDSSTQHSDASVGPYRVLFDHDGIDETAFTLFDIEFNYTSEIRYRIVSPSGKAVDAWCRQASQDRWECEFFDGSDGRHRVPLHLDRHAGPSGRDEAFRATWLGAWGQRELRPDIGTVRTVNTPAVRGYHLYEQGTAIAAIDRLDGGRIWFRDPAPEAPEATLALMYALWFLSPSG